jgi:hypothetical protein
MVFEHRARERFNLRDEGALPHQRLPRHAGGLDPRADATVDHWLLYLFFSRPRRNVAADGVSLLFVGGGLIDG